MHRGPMGEEAVLVFIPSDLESWKKGTLRADFEEGIRKAVLCCARRPGI